MRRQRRRLGFLGVLIGALGLTGVAFADVTTEHSGSILVFPKVIADGTRDTIIQMTNTSNSLVKAHCFYVNGALTDPSEPQSPNNPPLWQEIDFTIQFTRQQPTHWTVSTGRRVNPLDPLCGTGLGVCISGTNIGMECSGAAECPGGLCSNTGCTDAGFDIGLVPPVVPDFTGELKCIEIDDSGAPLSGNHLKGEATLVSIPNGDISKYNALAIQGSDNNGDGTLVLGGGQCAGAGTQQNAVCKDDAQCGDSAPCAIEYNACPQTWIVNHVADGAPNIAVESLLQEQVWMGAGSGAGMLSQSSVFTQLTIVPCEQNFETQEPTSVTLQFLTTDEFESQFSVSTTITCWANFFMSEIGATALTFDGTLVPDPQGTMFLKTKIRAAGGSPSGVLMVMEELHALNLRKYAGGAGLNHLNGDGLDHLFGDMFHAAAAGNVHVEGKVANPNIITVPDEQLQP